MNPPPRPNTPLAQELIRRKRDGLTLSPTDWQHVVAGLCSTTWSDVQIAALAMAIFVRGMADDETAALTRAMTHSGRVLRWPTDGGPVLDKHSSGGVGDKVSLMLAPLLAACGARVPMIAGRGLGHTGGTVDKLASIPGYCTQPDLTRFQSAVHAAGCAIIGQTDDLAPADRRLYAVRDVTATVESIPLITASILSKKLAAGLDGLVMDVKVGNGAFANTPAMAQALADSLVRVAHGAGLRVHAWITDMNQVLGHSAGNVLEVQEALDYLRGEPTCPRLTEVTHALGAEALVLGGLATDNASALQQLEHARQSGRALEHFLRMIVALGGPVDLAEHPERHLPAAPVQQCVHAPHDGWVGVHDTRAIGLVVLALGGGRRQAQDPIDPRVGLSRVLPTGTRVQRGEPLACIHAATQAQAQAAAQALMACLPVVEQPSSPQPVLWARRTMADANDQP
ncbi:MAG: thymidine phosphorylase [Rhodoferax sp.]